MVPSTARMLAFALAFLACGCGAANNLVAIPGPPDFGFHGPKHIYGGVVNDVEVIDACLDPSKSPGRTWPHRITVLALFVVVDLPLSAAIDTFTLPWTIPATVGSTREHNDGSREDSQQLSLAEDDQESRLTR